MAQILLKQNYTILAIFLFALLLQAQAQKFSEKLSPKSLGLKKEKLTHLHFYYHDVLSSNQPTVVLVAQSAITNTSKTGFGSTVIIDDPLTVGLELTSKIMGRAQGIVASADLNNPAYLFAINFVFTNDKYNGSSLSILGRNQVNLSVREMPIVGGSGLFRFARGYALQSTWFLNASTGDATAEYNVYVMHY